MEKYKICPSCKTKNPPALFECMNCESDLTGVKITDEETEKMNVESAAAQVKISFKMVRVCECGQKNASNARKCSLCNEDISDIPPTPDVEEEKAKTMELVLRSLDGSGIEKEIPDFGAIVSNLPFVAYNKIAADEIEYISEYRRQIKDNTGIEFTLGKTDLYNYLPFKLYELLKEGGRLGIILSNSWLGTDIGKKFFDALLYYYDILSVVISNCGRWFRNADVVATLLILNKKDIMAPNQESEINFWMLNKDLEQMKSNEQENNRQGNYIKCIVS